LALARTFRVSATNVGDYCYRNWATINVAERDQLRSLEVTLLNLATDLITQAVDVILDEAQTGVKALADVTAIAQKASENIEGAKRAITILTALISLAATIPTGNVVLIFEAAKAVKDSAEGKPETAAQEGKDAAAKGAKAAAGDKTK
jgi:hypothetical protein